jgi:hypothetical protein
MDLINFDEQPSIDSHGTGEVGHEPVEEAGNAEMRLIYLSQLGTAEPRFPS